MHTYIYDNVNLLKTYDNIHGMTYITIIILSGIVIINTGHFDNIKKQLLVLGIKFKRHCQYNIGVYNFVSHIKTRYTIATMHNILVIYIVGKKESVETIIQVHNYATVTGVCNKTMVKMIWYFF